MFKSVKISRNARNLCALCRSIGFLVLALVGFSIMAQAQYVTVNDEELAIWKERVNSGPYKKKGDVSSNSPGDWDRIVKAKSEFMSKPGMERYRPYVGLNSCIPTGSKEEPGRKGETLLQTAFYFLVTQDKAVGEAVKKELLAQASSPETDFTNSTRWCSNLDITFNPHFFIPEWLTRVLIAYDYVRPTMSKSEREKMDVWFYNAADFWDRLNEKEIAKFYKGARPSEPVTPPNFSANLHEYYGQKVTHYNGWDVRNGNKQWSNRRWQHARFIGQAGVFLSTVDVTAAAVNNKRVEEFKKNAKLFFKEWLTYCVYKDGTLAENYRWGESAGQRDQGFAYSGIVLASAVELADVFARVGDVSLYEYTTSGGFMASVGGPKNLLLTLQAYGKYIDGQWKRYATSDPAKVGDEMYLIDGIRLERPKGVTYMVNEVWFAKANLFYKDDYIKKLYMRSADGCKPYPYMPEQPFAYQSGDGTLPACLFMYGQMEGKAWPFSGQAPVVIAPSAPSDLNAVSASGSEIQLSWKDNSNNEKYFILEVSENVADGFKQLQKLEANKTSFTHKGLKANTEYHYRLKVGNDDGESNYTNTASAKTNPAVILPGQPTNLTAKSASMSEISLSWKSGGHETGFVLEYSKDGVVYSELATTEAAITTYVHKNLKVDQKYYYRLKAVNKQGESPYSEITVASTLSCDDETLVPVITASGNTIFCDGEGVELKAPAGYSEYNWLNIESNEQVVTVTKAGVYSVQALNHNGCWSKFSKEVVIDAGPQPAAPAIEAAKHVICPGEEILLKAPEGYKAYQWSNNANTREININKEGNYSLRVQDENGCWSAYSEAVKISRTSSNSRPVITLTGKATVCEGEKVTLSAPAGFKDYQWSTGEVTPTIEVSESGNYSVRVAAGCSNVWTNFSTPVRVDVHPVPSTPIVFSRGDSFISEAKGRHQWYLNGRAILGANTNKYVPVRKGQYAVEVSNEKGCSARADVAFTEQVEVNIINAYPNPNDGVFKVEITKPKHYEYELLVYNSINRTIERQTLSNFSDQGKITANIDVSGYGKGVYIVKLNALNFTKSLKVLVK